MPTAPRTGRTRHSINAFCVLPANDAITSTKIFTQKKNRTKKFLFKNEYLCCTILRTKFFKKYRDRYRVLLSSVLFSKSTYYCTVSTFLEKYLLSSVLQKHRVPTSGYMESNRCLYLLLLFTIVAIFKFCVRKKRSNGN